MTTEQPDFPFLCQRHGEQAYTFMSGYLRTSLTGEREHAYPTDMATAAKDLYDAATRWASACEDCATMQRTMEDYYATTATSA